MDFRWIFYGMVEFVWIFDGFLRLGWWIWDLISCEIFRVDLGFHGMSMDFMDFMGDLKGGFHGFRSWLSCLKTVFFCRIEWDVFTVFHEMFSLGF